MHDSARHSHGHDRQLLCALHALMELPRMVHQDQQLLGFLTVSRCRYVCPSLAPALAAKQAVHSTICVQQEAADQQHQR